MAEGPDITALVGELYAAEPAAFVATRKQLAAQLKSGGDKDGAATFLKLRKPTVLEDALNRTSRTDPEAVGAWAAAVDAASDAQSAAIGGGGSESLRAAAADLRAATTRLVKAASVHAGASKAGDVTALLQSLMTAGGVALVRRGVLGSAGPGDADELFAGAPDPPERSSASTSEPPLKRPGARGGKAASGGATAAPAGSAAAKSAGTPAAAASPARRGPSVQAVKRGPSAQAVKRHAAALEKATRARAVAEGEVTRLEAELARARERLESTGRALDDLERSAPV